MAIITRTKRAKRQALLQSIMAIVLEVISAIARRKSGS